MVGFSRGGLMAYICIRQQIDIRAAAVVGGPTNLLRQPQPLPMDEIHAELIGDRVRDVDQYLSRSALAWPDEINIPVLIQHGQEDDRVHVDDATELAEQLAALGKPHKLILYPDGNHRLSNHEAERDAEIFAWFDHYLRTP